jgi:hypothetical protein
MQYRAIESSISDTSPFLQAVKAGEEYICHQKEREQDGHSCSKLKPIERSSGNGWKWLIKIGVSIFRAGHEKQEGKHYGQTVSLKSGTRLNQPTFEFVTATHKRLERRTDSISCTADRMVSLVVSADSSCQTMLSKPILAHPRPIPDHHRHE